MYKDTGILRLLPFVITFKAMNKLVNIKNSYPLDTSEGFSAIFR